MKKYIAFLIVATIGGMVSAKYVWSGAGTQVTAATTPATYTIPGTNYAYLVSLHNTGTETVYFTKATSTNDFDASTSIPLAGGATYACSDDGEEYSRVVTAITYATTNGTSLVNIAFE